MPLWSYSRCYHHIAPIPFALPSFGVPTVPSRAEREGEWRAIWRDNSRILCNLPSLSHPSLTSFLCRSPCRHSSSNPHGMNEGRKTRVNERHLLGSVPSAFASLPVAFRSLQSLRLLPLRSAYGSIERWVNGVRHDEPNIRPETSVGRTEDLTEHQFFHHLFISSILDEVINLMVFNGIYYGF